MNKVGRNDPCPCGSGKKFKQCCGLEGKRPAAATPIEIFDTVQTYQSALEHQRAGRLREAVALLEQLIQRSPNHADALHLLGVIAHQLGKDELAIGIAEKAIKANPYNPHFYCNSGNMLFAKGMMDEAAARFRQALSLQPDYAPAHYDLAIVLHALGKTLDAIDSYHQAIKCDAGFVEAHYNLGNILAEQGDLPRAIDSYNQAIKLKPEFFAAHRMLGKALEALKELESAVVSYQTAIALKPNDGHAHFNLGHVYQTQGKIEDALASYGAALRFDPSLTEAVINVGILLQNLGRITEATAWLEKELIGNPREGWRIAALLLVAYWVAGRHEEARDTIRQYKQLVESLEPDKLDRSGRGALIFFILIAALLNNLEKQQELYSAPENVIPLHAFGESHCLVPANATFMWCGDMVTTKSHLVRGVKMFHLGQTETNQYKYCLATQLENTPSNSHLLFTIGEIDCRPDEGIWQIANKSDKPMEELITTTVNGYLDWLSCQLAERPFRSITVQGVPAPGYLLEGLCDANDRQAFLDMIRNVNLCLMKETNRRGWRFLDVHAATTDANGASNKKWHLDSHHVQPLLYAHAETWIR